MIQRSHDDAYDRLPEGVKMHVSRAQYAWLSDAEKNRLVEDFTTPDDDSVDEVW